MKIWKIMLVIKTFEGIYFFLKHHLSLLLMNIVEQLDLGVHIVKWLIHIDVLFGYRIQSRHPSIGYFLSSWLVVEHVLITNFEKIFKYFSKNYKHTTVSIKVLMVMMTSALFTFTEFNHAFILDNNKITYIPYDDD